MIPVSWWRCCCTAYASGIYSSRRIAKACEERVDFMMIAAQDVPDFRTISDFRKRHLKALEGLFVQVLKLAETAGLVKLGHVALDGTKIKANASKHKAMSYERMKTRESELRAEVQRRLAAAEAADAAEDAEHGADKRGDELPDWVADKERRIARIKAAKAEIEAEAKALAKEEKRRRAEADAKREAEGRKRPGKEPAPVSEEPDPKAQKNFTDPESRIMKSKDGFVQGLQCAGSRRRTRPDHRRARRRTNARGSWPTRADGRSHRSQSRPQAGPGLGRQRLLQRGEHRRARGAPDRCLRGTGPGQTSDQGQWQDWRPEDAGDCSKKIDDGGFETPYRLRKQVVEPVFGQIKQARGFRQFLLRGVETVRSEWALVCIGHNLTKLAKAS